MINLKELIKRPEYSWIEEYKDRICFLTLGGSYAYGTDVEGSDIDLRGVILPTKEELIGLQHFEQKIDNETDSILYEFNKFISLIKDCNPNTIELLGCREYLIFNEVGRQLLDNVNMFLSKKCLYTFGGYANAQLRKIENALCHDEYSQEDRVRHIKQTMDVAMNKLEEKNELFFNHSISTTIKDDKLYMSAHFDNIEIDKVRATLNDLLTIEKTFNKLGQRNNKKSEEKLDKHLMHLIRLYLTCFDILENHQVNTYREKDREFLLEIRKGKFIKNNQLTDECRQFLKELEERLQKDKEETTISDKPNFKAINDFVIEVNSKVINNTVLKYKEPLEEVVV